MPLKIWYNGSMHNMTTAKMVTFVGGVKKKIVKGVTFVNGQKKVLWQTGNFGIDSWTLSELQYPNQNGLPVGMYCDLNRVVYSVGEYIARSNVSNISNAYLENSVKNGRVCSWSAPYHTESVQSFASYTTRNETYTINSGGRTVSVTVTVTTVHPITVNSNDLSIVVGASTTDTKENPYLYRSVYTYCPTHGLVLVQSTARSE